MANERDPSGAEISVGDIAPRAQVTLCVPHGTPRGPESEHARSGAPPLHEGGARIHAEARVSPAGPSTMGRGHGHAAGSTYHPGRPAPRSARTWRMSRSRYTASSRWRASAPWRRR